MDELTHYGVKGMKWGRRKASETSGGGTPQRKIGFFENRRLNKAARKEFYQNKASTIMNEALKKNNEVLVKTLVYSPGNRYIPTIMTGHEFVSHVAKTGIMNAQYTEIVSKYNSKTGAYEANTNTIGRYKKQDFRKNPPK